MNAKAKKDLESIIDNLINFVLNNELGKSDELRILKSIDDLNALTPQK